MSTYRFLFVAASLMFSRFAIADVDFIGPAGAERWMRALATKDARGLGNESIFPLTIRTTPQGTRCGSTVRDKTALAKWLDCFRQERKLLFDELAAEPGVNIEFPQCVNPKPSAASKRLQRTAHSISPDGNWVYGYLNGDGVTFGFMLLTREQQNGRVRALVVEEEAVE